MPDPTAVHAGPCDPPGTNGPLPPNPGAACDQAGEQCCHGSCLNDLICNGGVCRETCSDPHGCGGGHDPEEIEIEL